MPEPAAYKPAPDAPPQYPPPYPAFPTPYVFYPPYHAAPPHAAPHHAAPHHAGSQPPPFYGAGAPYYFPPSFAYAPGAEAFYYAPGGGAAGSGPGAGYVAPAAATSSNAAARGARGRARGGRARSGDGRGVSVVQAAASARQTRADALDASAADAVRDGDDVVVALLVQSWAGSLAGVRAGGRGDGFEVTFADSNALGVVTRGVLFRGGEAPYGAVHEALVGLYAEVLYGGRGVLGEVVRRAVGVQAGKGVVDAFEALLQGLTGLKRALEGVGAAGRVEVADEERSRGDISPREGWLMRPWREALADLNAELVGVRVLREGIARIRMAREEAGMDEEGRLFLMEVRSLVAKALEDDVEVRSRVLREELWSRLSLGAGGRICGAVKTRAGKRLDALEKGKASVEADVRAMGMSFGKAGCVAPGKHTALLEVVRKVERLVEEHLDALDKSQAASEQLGVLLTSMRATGVASVAAGVVPPNKALQQFYDTVTGAFGQLDALRAWSFAGVWQKVVTMLQKSFSPKKKSIRFVEPEEEEAGVREVGVWNDNLFGEATPDAGDSGGVEAALGAGVSPAESLTPSGSGKRHKPRHARMKSSPDELLLFNARLDGSDEEGDLFAMEQEFRQVAAGLGPMHTGLMSSAAGGLPVPPASAGPPPAARSAEPRPSTPAPGAGPEAGLTGVATPSQGSVASLMGTPSTSVPTSVPSPVSAPLRSVSAAFAVDGEESEESDDGDDGGMIIHDDVDEEEGLDNDPAVGPVGGASGASMVGKVTELSLDGRQAGVKAAPAVKLHPTCCNSSGDESDEHESGRSEQEESVSPLPKGGATDSPVSGSTPRVSQSSPASAHMRSMSVDYLRY